MQSKQFGNSNLVSIISVAICVILLAYWFNARHNTIIGHWRSSTGDHNLAFFDDGTMNVDNIKGSYKWLSSDSMRIQLNGILGVLMQWFGGDIVVRVEIRQEVIPGDFEIRDMLKLTWDDKVKTYYRI